MDSNANFNQPVVNQVPVNIPSMNNSSNPTPANNTASENGEHKKVGPIIAILVIVLVLVIAALYLFASRLNREAVPPINTAISSNNTSNQNTYTPPANTTSVAPMNGKTDDVRSLQADLNASTNGVDSQNF